MELFDPRVGSVHMYSSLFNRGRSACGVGAVFCIDLLAAFCFSHNLISFCYGGDGHMKNVELTVEGTILTIKVDLSKDFGPSSSGKTTIIATTEGNVTIPNREEKIGLNIYKKKS